MRQLILLWFACIITFTNAGKILILPAQGKSHMIATNAIGQELKLNGHEVRFVLFFLLMHLCVPASLIIT